VRTGRWITALLVLAALGLGIAFWFGAAADEPVPGPAPAKDYYQSFKGATQKSIGFEFCGVNAEASVYFKPDGLCITLLSGWPGERPGTGVATTAVPVKGDFEVTVTFEVLAESAPSEDKSLFALDVVLDKPGANIASICRSVTAKGGPEFLTWMSLADNEPGKPRTTGRGFPTRAKSGRLRLARSGADISYYACEGSDTEFKLLERHAFTREDVKEIRILGATGGPKASLDVRVADLHVRSLPAAIAEQASTKEVYQDFRGKPPTQPYFRLAGPDLKAATKSEAGGFRITLPKTRKAHFPVEIAPTFAITTSRLPGPTNCWPRTCRPMATASALPSTSPPRTTCRNSSRSAGS
jgi:hypothetical protein